MKPRFLPSSYSLGLFGCEQCFNQTIQLLSQGSVVCLEFSPKLLHALLLPDLARFHISPEFLHIGPEFLQVSPEFVNPLALKTQDQPQHCQEDTWR